MLMIFFHFVKKEDNILIDIPIELAEAIIRSFVDTASLQIDTVESIKARMRTHFAVGYFNAHISNENMIRTEKFEKPSTHPYAAPLLQKKKFSRPDESRHQSLGRHDRRDEREHGATRR